jgi:hypothetical protein
MLANSPAGAHCFVGQFGFSHRGEVDAMGFDRRSDRSLRQWYSSELRYRQLKGDGVVRLPGQRCATHERVGVA